MSPHLVRSIIFSLGSVLLPAFIDAAHADAVSALRCQQTINKELTKFTKKKSAILRKCKENAVKSGVPASPVLCPLTPEDDKINLAAQKLTDKIAAGCGGANKLCNVADAGADADEPLADIGWNIGACPDLEGHGCTNAIADCNDIGACAVCIGHEAVNRATELYYDLMEPTEFATGSAVNKCQVSIGKATTKFLQTRSKLLQKCWGNVLAAKPGFTTPPGCPDTDGKTLAKLVVAEQKKVAAICKACGAGGDVDADLACDLPAPFGAAAIGFEPDCPNVTVPGSLMSCATPVVTLGELITCVDCVTDFMVDCATVLAVPAQAAYPAVCN